MSVTIRKVAIYMFQQNNDMLTVEELCEMLRISRNKGYQMLRQGVIHAFKEGRLWMIPKYSVVEYVKINIGNL